LNIKLSEIFQVKFWTTYETFIPVFPNFRKISVCHMSQPARTHTHRHTHTHTHICNTLPLCDGIYLEFHIQFSRYAMKLLTVALVNFPTNNYSCIVTATRHVMWFRVWHLLFYSVLQFYTATFLYIPAVPQPLSNRSHSTHTGTITNGTMAHSTVQHCYELLYRYVS